MDLRRRCRRSCCSRCDRGRRSLCCRCRHSLNSCSRCVRRSRCCRCCRCFLRGHAGGLHIHHIGVKDLVVPCPVSVIDEYPDVSEKEHIRGLLYDDLSVKHLPEAERSAVKARYYLNPEQLLADARCLRVEHAFHDHIRQHQKARDGGKSRRTAVRLLISVSVITVRGPFCSRGHYDDIKHDRYHSVYACRTESPARRREFHSSLSHIESLLSQNCYPFKYNTTLCSSCIETANNLVLNLSMAHKSPPGRSDGLFQA